MNVYVVMGDAGDNVYPANEVLGVFSTEEKATAGIAAYRKDPKVSGRYGDDFWIDCYAVDEDLEHAEVTDAQLPTPAPVYPY